MKEAAISHAIWATVLAKGIHRNRLIPLLRVVGFALAHLARRVDRARAAALGLGEDVVLRLIDAGKRECIIWRYHIVADAGQSRRFGRLVCNQVHDHGSAGLALRACGRRRFWYAAAEASVADDVGIGHELPAVCYAIYPPPAPSLPLSRLLIT